MNHQPCRLRRLGRVWEDCDAYFLTLCTLHRQRVLADPAVNDRMLTFATGSLERYGTWVDSYVLMPDHLHTIVTSNRSAKPIGFWVKALKAFLAQHSFRWQEGFFDHVLRSDESRSEKWEYIRMNPVRAGLVEHPEEWPYARAFPPFVVGRVTPPGSSSPPRQ